MLVALLTNVFVINLGGGEGVNYRSRTFFYAMGQLLDSLILPFSFPLLGSSSGFQMFFLLSFRCNDHHLHWWG
jgi:hypothetical protein